MSATPIVVPAPMIQSCRGVILARSTSSLYAWWNADEDRDHREVVDDRRVHGGTESLVSVQQSGGYGGQSVEDDLGNEQT